jgi:hypothetical protein
LGVWFGASEQRFAVGSLVDRGGEASGRDRLYVAQLELPSDGDAGVEQQERRYGGVAACLRYAAGR